MMWYNNARNIYLLVKWLVEVGTNEGTYSLEEIMPVLEEPWNWTQEFMRALDHFDGGSTASEATATEEVTK